MHLQMKVRDVYGKMETLVDEKDITFDQFPKIVTQQYLFEISEFLQASLPSIKPRDPGSLEVEAVLRVDLPDHKEKVSGSKGLKVGDE